MGFFSFAKTDRILKRSEFLRVSNLGKKLSGKYFIAIFCQGKLNRTRLGITVTKKVGRAVTRNRIKRFVREYFRLNRQNIKGIWDINIIAKKEAANITPDKAYSSLQSIFKRISRSIDH